MYNHLHNYNSQVQAKRQLTSLESGTKLTARHQQVQVVAPDEVLRQIDDGHHQRLLQDIYVNITSQISLT